MSTEVLCFAGGIVAPYIFHRIWYHMRPADFEKISGIRKWTGLNWHHGHMGFILLFLLIICAGNWRHNSVLAFFIGLAIGLVLDEAWASLKLPGNRPVELKVYAESISMTAVILVITLFVLFLAN